MMRLFLVLICFLVPSLACAHEVRPAIADFTAADGVLTLEVTLNAEALVSGISLEGIQDTDELDASDRVDALRALPPDMLLAQVRAMAPTILAPIAATADGAPLTWTLQNARTEEVGDTSLPRDTTLTLTAALPDGARTFELTWPAAYGQLILRQQGVEAPYTGMLTGGGSTGPIEIVGGDAPSGLAVFGQYIPVGFDHILPKGLDHILFVLGLFFLSPHLRTLVWQISAFTLAHTITLGLAALGYVNVSGAIVEPLIAASITYVAVENILTPKLRPWRPALIFAFGLLHGLGFASVLQEFGLPEGQAIPALLGFNVGVEIGQLTVIALAFLLVWVALRIDRGEIAERVGQIVYPLVAVAAVAAGVLLDGPGFVSVMGASAKVFFWPVAGLAAACALSATFVDHLQAYRRFVSIPASMAIAATGAYWVVERVFL